MAAGIYKSNFGNRNLSWYFEGAVLILHNHILANRAYIEFEVEDNSIVLTGKYYPAR